MACSMLVVVGVFTFIAAVCGYIGSRFRSLFLTIYLVAGSIATLIHAVMILVCFFAFDHVVARIDTIDAKDGKLIAKYVSYVSFNQKLVVALCMVAAKLMIQLKTPAFLQMNRLSWQGAL